MPDPKLEEVFKTSGVPSLTFVKPLEYERLLIALRTPGRGVVVEGPSGIGKTTSVAQALDELGAKGDALVLSARKKEDVDLIRELPGMNEIGTVIIDDFHRLEDAVRSRVADFLKVVADEERSDVKIAVVGINRAGEMLVTFGRDLNTRIETIRFEANPDARVEQLVRLGEDALNIELGVRQEIVESANGSFAIAQLLAQRTCLAQGVTEAVEGQQARIEASFELIRNQVVEDLARSFDEIAVRFARGKRLRSEGRAPYLHILKWLAEANEWSIFVDREMSAHTSMKGSVGQVVDKGFLEELLADSDIASVLHYEPQTRVLAVEDPQFVFYIRSLAWNEFARRVGYTTITFESQYDFALSFAGSDRDVAERLFEVLTEDGEISVFYDRNEQHRILAENIEDYLGPIYRSEASFVVVLLGPNYPERIWTKFESDQFKERFGEGRVIPIWFSNSPPGMFDESRKYGGVTLDRDGELEPQLQSIGKMLMQKLAEERSK